MGGEAIWCRMRGSRWAHIGLGRSGSMLAIGLRRVGMRHQVLIDPDRLELHNLDGMSDLVPSDVGRPKVEALRDALVRLNADDAGVEAIPLSIAHTRAFAAVRDADFLISCPDSDAARLTTAIVAALFAKTELYAQIMGDNPQPQR